MMLIRVLLFLTVFATALMAGYGVGANLDPFQDAYSDQVDSRIMPGVAIPDNDQVNLLLIGVDDVDRPDAQLESIWLVAHAKDSANITLIPVFPSLDDPAQNLTLTESFRLDGGEPSIEFWDEMRNSDFWWRGYIIIDIATSIRLVDILGGVEFNGLQMNGLQAIGSITSWKNDTSIAINNQKVFIESICNQIAVNHAPNLKAISGLLDQIQVNKQTKISIAGWTPKIAPNEKLTCAFPTLTHPSLQTSLVNP